MWMGDVDLIINMSGDALPWQDDAPSGNVGRSATRSANREEVLLRKCATRLSSG